MTSFAQKASFCPFHTSFQPSFSLRQASLNQDHKSSLLRSSGLSQFPTHMDAYFTTALSADRRLLSHNSLCILPSAMILLAMVFTQAILISPHIRETVNSTNETFGDHSFSCLSPGQEVGFVLKMRSVTCSFPTAFLLGSLEMQNKLFSYSFMPQKTYLGLQRKTHWPTSSKNSWRMVSAELGMVDLV